MLHVRWGCHLKGRRDLRSGENERGALECGGRPAEPVTVAMVSEAAQSPRGDVSARREEDAAGDG